MALESTELLVGANGSIAFDDAATATLPTDPDAALDAGFTDLGYITDEGAMLSYSIEREEITAWQSATPIRYINTSQEVTLEASLMQWNPDTLSVVLGGVMSGGIVNEVQTVALTGFDGGTADSFKITQGGGVVGSGESVLVGLGGLAYTAGNLKIAIEGTVGFYGEVSVSAVTNAGFTVEFQNDYAGVNVTLMTITTTTGCSGLATEAQAGGTTGGPPYTFTPDDIDAEPSFRAVVLTWEDGSRHYRAIFPRCMVVTDSVEVQLTRTDVTELKFTIKATPEAGDPAFTIITDDVAFA